MLSSIIQLSIGIYVMVQGRRGKNLWFSCTAIAASVYSLGYAFELTAQTVSEALVYIRIEYLGIAFLPTFGLLTALEFTGNRWRLNNRPAMAMLTFSMLTLVSMHTTNLHHLYYADLLLTKVGTLTIVRITGGPWYKVSMAYAHLALAFGAAAVGRSIRTAPANLKPGYWIFLTGLFLPWVSNAVYLSGLSPYGIDLAPYGFMAMNVLLLIGLSPNELFELVSLAKNKVFDSMDDIVVIIDRGNRVIDYNPALYQIVPERRQDYADEQLSTLFKAHPQIAQFATAHTDGETTIALDDGSSRVFRARIRTIAGSGRLKGNSMLAKYLTMTDVTREMTMVRTMRDLANLDSLTGIANRRSFYDQMEQLTGGQQVGGLVSVIMLDIDHFKTVNDTHGHKAGDTLLHRIASLLSQNTRAQDILARYGGEEFIIAVPGMNADNAVALAERLRMSISAFEEVYDGHSIKVTASFGVACDAIGPDFDTELLIKDADAALYEAKSSGRNAVVLSAARPSSAVSTLVATRTKALRDECT